MDGTPDIVVDTHVHFWELKRFPYSFPTAENGGILYRDVFPSDYKAAIRDTPVKNAIFVQVLNKNYPENEWVFDLAKTNPWIVGVVGWVDMTDPHVEDILRETSKNPLFLGIRHITDLEDDENWIGRAEVQPALAALEKLGLTYDLLVRPHTAHWASHLAAKYPKLRFVINHIGKPKSYVNDELKASWKDGIINAAKHPNVFCKLSGLVPEQIDPGDLTDWKTEDFKPYVEHCVKHFGANRCLFGGDFPVFEYAGATYQQIYQLLKDCLVDCTTPEERDGIWGKNAVDIYKIKVPLIKNSS